jgi:hypothetical protein
MSQPEERFRLRLAGYLGKFPHEIDEMPTSDFIKFMIYEQMEPFGDMAQYLHTGTIASTLINLKLPRGSEPIMPDRDEPKEIRQNIDEQLAQWNMIMLAQNSSLPKA